MKKKNKQPGWVPMVHVIRDREFTIAFGEYWDDNFGCVPFAGATKKNPKDHENVGRGERLAIGNAFRHLGRGILKAEYEAIHTQFGSKPKKVKKESGAYADFGTIRVFDIEEELPNWEDEGTSNTSYLDGYDDGYDQALEDSRE